MNIALWIVAGLLAAAFLLAGGMKLVRSREDLLGAGMGFVEDFPMGAVRAIGALEVLAAIGLILPAALGIAPILVPLAATGLVLMMVGATIVHIRRGETNGIAPGIVLLLLALFVAWGRFGPYAF
ncbi:DoxX family protein [Actinoplanes sp. NPDC049118]|uniref:DoxX family protein n=1 Tax=Actinoplanes sp. NPDC049118 TaxID=3155769 RepID=UPI0033DA4451